MYIYKIYKEYFGLKKKSIYTSTWQFSVAKTQKLENCNF